jgi:hypothetical protein
MLRAGSGSKLASSLAAYIQNAIIWYFIVQVTSSDEAIVDPVSLAPSPIQSTAMTLRRVDTGQPYPLVSLDPGPTAVIIRLSS